MSSNPRLSWILASDIFGIIFTTIMLGTIIYYFFYRGQKLLLFIRYTTAIYISTYLLSFILHLIHAISILNGWSSSAETLMHAVYVFTLPLAESLFYGLMIARLYTTFKGTIYEGKKSYLAVYISIALAFLLCGFIVTSLAKLQNKGAYFAAQIIYVLLALSLGFHLIFTFAKNLYDLLRVNHFMRSTEASSRTCTSPTSTEPSSIPTPRTGMYIVLTP